MEYSLRKSKKIILEYQILKMELEDSKTLYGEYEEEFLKEVIKYIEENDISVSKEAMPSKSKPDIAKALDDSEGEASELSIEQPDVKSKLSSDMKKIYKQIVLKIHPDRIINQDGDIKQKYKDLYNKTQSAAKKLDYLEIIDIANDLDIKMPELSDDSISKIKSNLSSVQNQIESYKSKYPWIWFNSPESEREIHIKEFLDTNKGNINNILKYRTDS